MVDLAAVLPAADSGALVIEGPADDRVSLAADAPRQVMLRAAGFYSVRPQADRGRTLALMAVNPDPAESDLARLDPEELALAVAPQGRDDGAIRTAGPSASAEVLERRQVLWWYLLLGVLLLLGAETLVASRAGAR